jgi:hypothetical protein
MPKTLDNFSQSNIESDLPRSRFRRQEEIAAGSSNFHKGGRVAKGKKVSSETQQLVVVSQV